MAEKLVRDLLDRRIPADQLRIEQDPELVRDALKAKFAEESGELAATDYSDVGEFADVIEVLQALAAQRGITSQQIEEARLAKLVERGGFQRGLIYCPPED